MPPNYKFDDKVIIPLWKQWKENPTPQNMSMLIDALTPLLRYSIDYYASDVADYPSILPMARKLAINAVRKYDVSKGALVPYIMTSMRRMQRYAGTARQLMRVPERLSLARSQMTRFIEDWKNLYGREPTADEIADNLGVSIKTIERIRNMPNVVTETIAARNLEEPSGGALQAKPIGEEDTAVKDVLEYMYIDADPKDKVIIDHVFGLHGAKKLSQTEIAKKLGISVPAVTQRLNRIYKEIPQWHALLQ